jgi:hypothetical protein
MELNNNSKNLIQNEHAYVVVGKIQNAMWMVGLIGLEPMTLRLSSACSNQLSYRPKLVFSGAVYSLQVKTEF